MVAVMVVIAMYGTLVVGIAGPAAKTLLYTFDTFGWLRVMRLIGDFEKKLMSAIRVRAGSLHLIDRTCLIEAILNRS